MDEIEQIAELLSKVPADQHPSLLKEAGFSDAEIAEFVKPAKLPKQMVTGRLPGETPINVATPLFDGEETLLRVDPKPTLGASEARAALATADKTGSAPEFALANSKEQQTQILQDDFVRQVRGLPRLASYAGRSDVHATAVANDVDNLGVIEYALGKSGAEVYGPEFRAAHPEGPGEYERGWLRDTWKQTGETWEQYDRRVNQEQKKEAEPGWVTAWGLSVFQHASLLRDYFSKLTGEFDAQRHEGDAAVLAETVPLGADKKIGKYLFRGQEVVQGVAPFLVNPAATFGLMYAEGAGRVYGGLRSKGYEHEDAAFVAEAAGFTSASIGSFFGSKFFGSLMPKKLMEAVGYGVPNTILQAVSTRPDFWKFALGAGYNQLHATLMNVGMAVSEDAIVKGLDLYRSNKPFDYSGLADTFQQAVRGALEFAPLSIWGARNAHAYRKAMWEAGEPLRKHVETAHAEALRDQEVFDRYEKQGLALRSIKDAADIAAAADAVKRSAFMQENPEEGAKLLKHLIAPRKTQSVFVDPKALLNLEPPMFEALGVKNLPAAAHTGTLAEVPIDKFLMSEAAPQLAKHTSASQDQLTPAEAGRWLSKEEVLAHYDQVPGEGGVSLPLAGDLTPEQRQRAGISAPINVAVTAPGRGQGSVPAPEESPPPLAAPPARARVAKPRTAGPLLGFRGKMTADRLRGWAAGEAEGKTAGELDTLIKNHEANAARAHKDAENYQKQATEALARSTKKAQTGVESGKASGRAGRVGIKEAIAEDRVGAAESYDFSEAKGKHADARGEAAVKEEVKAGDAAGKAAKAEKIARVNDAMAEALGKAKGEHDKISGYVNGQESTGARETAYKAGWEYGTAQDAIIEAVGGRNGKIGGYAAPDVSDVYEQMRLDGFKADFDVAEINRLLVSPKSLSDMTLPEARKVREALKQIEDAATSKVKFMAAETRLTVEEARAKVIEHTKNLDVVPRGQNSWLDSRDSLTAGERLKAETGALGATRNQLATILFKLGEVGDKLFFDRYVPARTREERLHADLMPDIAAIHDNVPDVLKLQASDEVPSLPGSPGHWGRRTRGEIWRLALHLGTESGIEKISRGLRVSPEALVSWVQANLGRTPADATLVMDKLIDPTWKVFSKLWDGPMQKHLEERGLPPPPPLKHAPMTVNGKVYDGGYGGRLTWIERNSGSTKHVDPNSMAALRGFDYYGAATEQAHLEERTGVSGIPNLDWRGVPASLKAEIHDIAFDGFVTDALKLFGDEEMRATLSDKLGKNVVEDLYSPTNDSSLLHTIARGHGPSMATDPLVRNMVKLNGRAAVAAFLLNLKVLAIQPIDVIMVGEAKRLDFTSVIRGVYRAFDPQRREWAHANSEVLPYRHSDFERHNNDMIAEATGYTMGDSPVLLPKSAAPVGKALGEVTKGLAHFSHSIYNAMDSFTAHAIWEAQFDHTLRQTGDQKLAFREAEKTIQIGTPPQNVYEQSKFAQDRSFAGMFFLVRNYPDTLYNLGAMRLWDARLRGEASGGFSSKLAISKAVASFLGGIISADLLSELVAGRGPDRDKDGNAVEGWDSWALRRSVRTAAYPFMLGDLAEAGVRYAQGDKRRALQDALRFSTTPGLGLASRAIQDLGEASIKQDAKAVRGILDVLGLGINVPLSRFYDWGNTITGD